ncbi:MAG: PAS domain S-box protein [Candidatus Scalindua sp.]
MTIRKRILFWFLIPSILTAGIAATFCYYYIRRTIEQNIFDQLELAADELREHIKIFLKAKKDRIVDFSSDGFIKTCTEKIVHGIDTSLSTSRLNRHLILNKKPVDEENLLEVFIVDLDGKVISSTETSHVGQDVSGEVYFSKVKEKRVFVNDLHYSPESRQNTFEVAGLLTAKEGMRPIGIIVNRYRGDNLTGVTRSGISNGLEKGRHLEGMGETGEVYIVNSERLMITESRFIEGAILKQVVDTEGVRAGFENVRGTVDIYSDYRGIQILGVSRYIEDMDWVVLAEKDVSEAFIPLLRIRNLAIVIGITGIIIVVAIAIFVSAEITRPINKLIAGTKRIADGDLIDPIITGKRKGEVEALGESFNMMMDKLRISNEKNARLLLEIEEKGKDEWHKTFDVITDIITIHDKDYRIVRANKAFYERFNISAEELSDRKCYEIFHGTSEPWPTCPLTKTAESLKPEHVEIDDPCMGGSFIVSTYPILDEKGKFCGAVHQGKDITEWKKAEEELRRGKEYTESLIETAQDAIVCIDENGVVNIWNQAAYRIFGYKENQIIGSSIKNIISINILDRFLEMSKIIKFSRVLEVSGKTKDGNVIPLEMSISSQKIEEGRHTFTMIIRDITFQKEAKKELAEKANMLAKINRELEEFVYIVSHDLKEPLFAIEGYTSRLYRAYKDIYDDKEKHYIDRIRANVKRMSRKIQEIMEVLKAGRIAYNFRENETDTIVKEIVSSLENSIKTNKINVLIENNLPAVFCDEKRIKDVFSNLITNAIKFIGNGKQAETPRNPLAKEQSNGDYGVIRIGCHKNDDCYKFFVEDSGIGIQEKYQGQIFKIFRRLNDIETEGTGVGLAIVKKIVELHGGNLWVKSPLKDGRGSRFCFTIPLEKKDSDQHDMQGDVDSLLGVPLGTSI